MSDNVFVAGACCKNGKLLTSGGRVLGVTAVAHSLDAAIAKSYEIVDKIHFDNAFCRKDIGAKAMIALKEGK